MLPSFSYAFNRLASSMQTETEHFDPYHVSPRPTTSGVSVGSLSVYTQEDVRIGVHV